MAVLTGHLEAEIRLRIRRQHHIQQSRSRGRYLHHKAHALPLRHIAQESRFLLFFFLLVIIIAATLLHRLHLQHPGIAELQGPGLQFEAFFPGSGRFSGIGSHRQLHAVEKRRHIYRGHGVAESHFQPVSLVSIGQPFHAGTQLWQRIHLTAHGKISAEPLPLLRLHQKVPLIICRQGFHRTHHHMPRQRTVFPQLAPYLPAPLLQLPQRRTGNPLLQVCGFHRGLNAPHVIGIPRPEARLCLSEHKAQRSGRRELHAFLRTILQRAHHNPQPPGIHEGFALQFISRTAELHRLRRHRLTAQVGGAGLYPEGILRGAGGAFRETDAKFILVRPPGNGFVLIIPGNGKQMPPQVFITVMVSVISPSIAHHGHADQRLGVCQLHAPVAFAYTRHLVPRRHRQHGCHQNLGNQFHAFHRIIPPDILAQQRGKTSKL